jgi:alkylation response protein AidB-like acyl-CoA dehydrogenase
MAVRVSCRICFQTSAASADNAAPSRASSWTGTLPLDLVGRLRAAGVFRALQLRALGGFELTPVEFIAMIEEFQLVSETDGAGGTLLSHTRELART